MLSEEYASRKLSEIALATEETARTSGRALEKLQELRVDLTGKAFETDMEGFFAGIRTKAFRVIVLLIIVGQLVVAVKIMRRLEAGAEGRGAPTQSAIESKHDRGTAD
jgi:hypothetical protein